MTIGNKLKSLRKEEGLTQKDLALKLGTVQSVIGDMEYDRRPPSKLLAQKLAAYFKTTIEYWLNEDAVNNYAKTRDDLASTRQVIEMLKNKNMIINGIPNDKAWTFIKRSMLIDLEFMDMEDEKKL